MGDGSISEGMIQDEVKEIYYSYENTPITVTPHKKQIGGDHYKSMAIQPYEYIVANDIGWLEGNAIKYISRYKQKGGKADIEKAIHYLELLLAKL